jgi:hypothetical protein
MRLNFLSFHCYHLLVFCWYHLVLIFKLTWEIYSLRTAFSEYNAMGCLNREDPWVSLALSSSWISKVSVRWWLLNYFLQFSELLVVVDSWHIKWPLCPTWFLEIWYRYLSIRSIVFWRLSLRMTSISFAFELILIYWCQSVVFL